MFANTTSNKNTCTQGNSQNARVSFSYIFQHSTLTFFQLGKINFLSGQVPCSPWLPRRKPRGPYVANQLFSVDTRLVIFCSCAKLPIFTFNNRIQYRPFHGLSASYKLDTFFLSWCLFVINNIFLGSKRKLIIFVIAYFMLQVMSYCRMKR